jgi:hypothetical protein
MKETDIEVRGKLNLREGAEIRAQSMRNERGAQIDMVNGRGSVIEVEGEFNTGGKIKIELLEGGGSSKIIAGGDVNIEDGIAELEVEIGKVEGFKRQEYSVIESLGMVKGKFNVKVGDRDRGRWDVRYEEQRVSVAVVGTNFKGIKSLSKNGQAIGEVYDRISMGSKGLFRGVKKGKKEDIGEIISKIYALGSDEEINKALTEASGYFLSNVIRRVGVEEERMGVYERLEEEGVGGIWVGAIGNSVRYDPDEDSLGEYKESEVGVMSGVDIGMRKRGDMASIKVGIYGKVGECKMEQGKSEGKIGKGGCGVYGGYIGDRFDVMCVVDGNYDEYNVERVIEIGDIKRKARSGFKGLEGGCDIEGGIKADVGIETRLRTYVGLTCRGNMYGKIEESDAESLDLIAESGIYKRMSARIGLGIIQSVNRLSLGATVEYKYLLFGELSEIISKLDENMDLKFKTLGSNEGKTTIGLGVNGSCNMTENMYLFAKANFYIADGYSSISGNIGMVYKFGVSGKDQLLGEIFNN